ncbi:MAG: hypothetical protein AAGP08_00035 [Pseudomonadota bacterium]
MRRISLNTRRHYEAETGGDVEMALLQFEHASLATPLRLSTDPTERLSTDPLRYGTRSTWNGADPLTEPYLFIIASAEFPGDQEDGATPATLVLQNIHAGIGRVLTSFTDRATCHLGGVFADAPNEIVAEVRNLKLVSARGNEDEFVLTLEHAAIGEETVPWQRMTATTFPGLFR